MAVCFICHRNASATRLRAQGSLVTLHGYTMLTGIVLALVTGVVALYPEADPMQAPAPARSIPDVDSGSSATASSTVSQQSPVGGLALAYKDLWQVARLPALSKLAVLLLTYRCAPDSVPRRVASASS